ncbi:class I SAM-dependent DNA methyltransferase [Mycobacteroides abscessus]|uniref:class I SAM-dependent DNA methyltransferase n=1 Tax=Mycobacteroides abscessus TaxID=36809 RepID=UPI000929250D|nr:DNA methyltransferase [Mycobacteroides abscessus]SIJ94507.1 N-6 DNA Methylase [Mycobacteroides abscessus subsp. abscessus]SLF07278.1 N-6 DNA Methylase [Mycobacteroides abscessus subsp. abscessus]
MTDNRLLDLVDSRDFRTLFIDELGWDNPDRPPLTLEVDGSAYTLTQVAGYKGLRIWHCPTLPPRPVQRQIDVLVGKDNLERLVIFTDEQRQEWRWPRRAQLGSANAKLVVHQHLVGDRATHLTDRLRAIELDFDKDVPLVALLERMRDAFDHEAESAAVAAARLMGKLYTHLEDAGVGEHDATLLLARLLFLFFGDDADMWEPAGIFERYLRDSTTAGDLHRQLIDLFDVLDAADDKRDLAADSPLAQFRYINGGLFHGPLRLPRLPDGFRDALLEACDFDWSMISPAVFGSMFQTVKSKEARRHGGEHYTTEANILKTIQPLFLDEYRERLKRAWDDKAKLTRLHNELAQLRFLDPACGCGNFLVVAYRELRALELEILRRRRDLDMEEAATKKVERAQLSLDVTGDVKVTIDHFFGIEIDEWPAHIAETAMLLVDHLANQQMELEFGVAPDRLPIKIASEIHQGNALEVDWNAVLPASDRVIVFGNPPYAGQKERTAKQTADMRSVWGSDYNGNLDYVSAWFRKATEYLTSPNSRFAFVATSSICQGQSVAPMWIPILQSGWTISFAHRPFDWDSESANAAGVHVVIVGMVRGGKRVERTLFHYADNGLGQAEVRLVENINPYLLNGPDVAVKASRRPVPAHLPSLTEGSKLWDFNNLVIKPEELDALQSDPIAAKFIRPLLSNTTLLKGKPRWVLWLRDADPAEWAGSELIEERLRRVKQGRTDSADAEANRKADTPHLFTNYRQPSEPYLAIPKVTGHSRLYLPAAYSTPDIIVNNTLFTAPDSDGFIFAIVSSRIFAIWQRLAGGHTRADVNFSNTLVWNTFPIPESDSDFRTAAIAAGAAILEVRKKFPGKTLEALYDASAMPAELLAAHRKLDAIVEKHLDVDIRDIDQCEVRLLTRYAQMIGGQGKSKR